MAEMGAFIVQVARLGRALEPFVTAVRAVGVTVTQLRDAHTLPRRFAHAIRIGALLGRIEHAVRSRTNLRAVPFVTAIEAIVVAVAAYGGRHAFDTIVTGEFAGRTVECDQCRR